MEKNHKLTIVTLIERKSQFELMAKTDYTKAASIKRQMINLLALLSKKRLKQLPQIKEK